MSDTKQTGTKQTDTEQTATKQTGTSIATPSLPINPRNGKIDRSAFTYDPVPDACPAGRSLPVLNVKTDKTPGGPVKYTLYRCDDCTNCTLAPLMAAAKVNQRAVPCGSTLQGAAKRKRPR